MESDRTGNCIRPVSFDCPDRSGLSAMNECIVCNNAQTHPLYSGVVKCQQCGHVFCNRYLDEEELSKLYKKDYFFGEEYSNYLADKNVLQKNFKLRMKVLQGFLEPARHRHLLEIGCAYGFFLDTVRNQFSMVRGIDITEDGIRYAQEQLKLDVVNDDFIRHDFRGMKFDVVCMWDTIEHLQEPQLYLKKISKNMEEGALLALTTGDIASVNARIKKSRWRLMHPPTHLHYFSGRTLTRVLDNYGFDVIYNRYCGFYRSINTAAYTLLVLRNKWSLLYSLLRKTGLTSFDFYSNLYDIMYVIARRR